MKKFILIESLFVLTLVSCFNGEFVTSSNSISVNDETNYISFLGDSISTYDDYSNNPSYNETIKNNVKWYPNTNYKGADLDVKDTWWYKVSEELDYEICVNNSWSGSCVKDEQTYDKRAKNLHNNDNKNPDIIVVLMGVNDYANGTSIGSYDGNGEVTNINSFSDAYGKMIINMKESYPESEIFCSTFLPDRKRFNSNTNSKGIKEDDYNDVIRVLSKNLDVNLIDLYLKSGINSQNIGDYTVDKLHPNAMGMNLISEMVISSINKALF